MSNVDDLKKVVKEQAEAKKAVRERVRKMAERLRKTLQALAG